MFSSSRVIGIAGGTGSGKTTLARALVERLGTDRAIVIDHDRYYRDHPGKHHHELAALNFDHPDALDTALLIEHLRDLRAGRAVDLPVYDFTRHVRSSRTERVEPGRTVIVEGILVLASPALRELMDVKVFVDTEDDLRFIRRLERDMRERGRTMQSVIDQYLATVRPMHIEFVEPSKKHADIVISGSAILEEAVTRLESLKA